MFRTRSDWGCRDDGLTTCPHRKCTSLTPPPILPVLTIAAEKECFLNRFWEKTRQLTPAEIAQALHDVSNHRAAFFITSVLQQKR